MPWRMVLCTLCLFATGSCGSVSQALLIEPEAPPACTQLGLKPCQPGVPQDTIRLTFCQPDSARTQLVVLDILGKEVATIVDSVLCPDWYSYEWSTRGLANGIYFVRLTSKGGHPMKKFRIIGR